MKKKLSEIQPTTLNEATQFIINNLDASDIKFIKDNTHLPYQLHHTVGQNMRNDWHLWEKESSLATWFRTNMGLGHADDMSSIILQIVWHSVRIEAYSEQDLADYYKNYWTGQGINPLTLEKIK